MIISLLPHCDARHSSSTRPHPQTDGDAAEHPAIRAATHRAQRECRRRLWFPPGAACLEQDACAKFLSAAAVPVAGPCLV